jgi:hypothetical protein
MMATGMEDGRMAPDRQAEVEALYKEAQKILLHEMTEDERLFVAELGWDDHATLPEEKLARLRELVRTKFHKQGAHSE